ncbi:MAG: prephenate dehydratase [Bdellovibrionales bacterium]
MPKTIAFQGAPGAYSDLACRTVFPGDVTLPCLSFDEAFTAVKFGKADYGMIAVENAIAGRVADVHHLLPTANLSINGEHFQPICHHLLAIPGARLEDIREVHSHVQALAQCRDFLQKHGIKPVVHADTAGGAADVAKRGDKSVAAIASELAGQLYGLQSLAADIANLPNNTTRFLILSRDENWPEVSAAPTITSAIFRVRSVPAALYKALGGFATNGINITKIESYLVNGSFIAAQFYLDAEGHPKEPSMMRALNELCYFANEVTVLGVYPASPYRKKMNAEESTDILNGRP